MPFWICRQRAGSCGNIRAELAPTRYRDGSQLAGFTQSGVPAKTAGRSIKRMVQPRKISSDGYNWESPIEGQTLLGGDTRRSSIFREKARVARVEKGTSTWQGPGVRPSACGDR